MDAFEALKRGAAEAEAGDAADARKGLAKAWNTVAHNDRRKVVHQKQQGLVKWIRPSAWMASPLELSGDVTSMIVEALMRDGSVRTIKAFALVNRACAAAVSSTLASCRAQLKRLAVRLEMAEEQTSKRTRRRTRREVGFHDGLSSSESSSDEDGGESDAANGAYDARVDFLTYMKSIGIQKLRAHLLSAVPGSVWFHDNKSLLGHLQGGCELCDNIYGVSLLPRGGGPVALFACDRCKNKGCVDLTLEFGDDVHACTLVARVDARETEANNYARALLSKRLAHRKRMLSNRAAGVPAPNLGKRVHTIEFTDPLLLAYSASTHAMSRSPWPLELWHELPKSIPQHLTFGGVLGLRGSDAVRDEAQLHSARRRRARSDGAKRRVALAQMLRSYLDAHQAVRCITDAGYGGWRYGGWVQVIDLCSAARSFAVRWMFKCNRPHEDGTQRRNQQYKLLDMDAAERDAAVRRVETVARVVRMRVSRVVPQGAITCNCSEREMTLALLRNLDQSFLEGPAKRVDALVETLKRAPVCISLRKDRQIGPQILEVCFALDATFEGRQLKITSYVYNSAANRIAKLVGRVWSKGSDLNHAIIDDFDKLANMPLDTVCTLRNEARTLIFRLPVLWPKWLTA